MRTYNRGMVLGLIATVAAIGGQATAQDWPQWRGPERTGAVSDSPRLIDAIPEKGLTELWRSEPIPDTAHPGGKGSDVGFSSPVAAGGRVYLYLNQRVKDERPSVSVSPSLECQRLPVTM